MNKYICSICDCPVPTDDPAYAGWDVSIYKHICRICDCPVPSDDPAYAGCDAEECDVCNCAPCKKGQTCTKT